MDEKDKSPYNSGNKENINNENFGDTCKNKNIDKLNNDNNVVSEPSFVVLFEDTPTEKWRKKKANTGSLQDAFLKFRQKRQVGYLFVCLFVFNGLPQGKTPLLV